MNQDMKARLRAKAEASRSGQAPPAVEPREEAEVAVLERPEDPGVSLEQALGAGTAMDENKSDTPSVSEAKPPEEPEAKAAPEQERPVAVVSMFNEGTAKRTCEWWSLLRKTAANWTPSVEDEDDGDDSDEPESIEPVKKLGEKPEKKQEKPKAKHDAAKPAEPQEEREDAKAPVREERKFQLKAKVPERDGPREVDIAGGSVITAKITSGEPEAQVRTVLKRPKAPEPRRDITIPAGPPLDLIHAFPHMSREELEQELGQARPPEMAPKAAPEDKPKDSGGVMPAHEDEVQSEAKAEKAPEIDVEAVRSDSRPQDGETPVWEWKGIETPSEAGKGPLLEIGDDLGVWRSMNPSGREIGGDDVLPVIPDMEPVHDDPLPEPAFELPDPEEDEIPAGIAAVFDDLPPDDGLDSAAYVESVTGEEPEAEENGSRDDAAMTTAMMAVAFGLVGLLVCFFNPIGIVGCLIALPLGGGAVFFANKMRMDGQPMTMWLVGGACGVVVILLSVAFMAMTGLGVPVTRLIGLA